MACPEQSRQPAGQGAGLTKGSVSSRHFDPMDKAWYLDQICNHRFSNSQILFSMPTHQFLTIRAIRTAWCMLCPR